MLPSMAGALHAVLLLSLVAATAVAIARYRRGPSNRRVVFSLLAGLAAALVLASIRHMCMLGQPVAQWLVPSVCMTASLLWVGAITLRRVLVGTSLVLGMALTWDYLAVVHGPTFVGTQDHYQFVGPTEREWHSWISGLYRRRGAPPGRKGN